MQNLHLPNTNFISKDIALVYTDNWLEIWLDQFMVDVLMQFTDLLSRYLNLAATLGHPEAERVTRLKFGKKCLHSSRDTGIITSV